MDENQGFLSSFTGISTVVIVGVILVVLLVQFEGVSILLAVPIFVVLMGAYTTAAGLIAEGKENGRRHSYYFLWALIMVEVGLDWILLTRGFRPIDVFLIALGLALVYIYLNWGKSRRRSVPT